jgi:diguanylate cyclase (GGDEF)-like protein
MHTASRLDHQPSLDINGLRSEFSSDDTEIRFLTHHLAETQKQVCSTLLFCSLFYLAFSLTDVAVLGSGRHALILFLGRLAVAVTAAVCCLLISRRPQSVAMTRLAATAVEVVGMSVFMLIVAYRPAELPWHAMSMAIMVVVVYIFIPNRLVYSLAVALPATGVFIYQASVVGQLPASDMLTMSMLLLLANTFGAVAARRYHRLWREEFRAQTLLKNLTMHDPLTGCFNRRYLHEQLLDSEISRAQRYRLSLTVIMCDLDHFKHVNDSYGHQGGDAVLQRFSRMLKDMTRTHIDSVVRYGGEEFLLILPETDLHKGAQLAERQRVTFAADTTAEATHAIQATASFGVASIDFAHATESITLMSLISSADTMLYDAKKAGRNQVKAQQLPLCCETEAYTTES